MVVAVVAMASAWWWRLCGDLAGLRWCDGVVVMEAELWSPSLMLDGGLLVMGRVRGKSTYVQLLVELIIILNIMLNFKKYKYHEITVIHVLNKMLYCDI